jgi:hypothetical protein
MKLFWMPQGITEIVLMRSKQNAHLELQLHDSGVVPVIFFVAVAIGEFTGGEYVNLQSKKGTRSSHCLG